MVVRLRHTLIPGSARVPPAGERVLAIANFAFCVDSLDVIKSLGNVCFGETPKPIRETRALPEGICCRDYSYSPALRRKLAIAYSRLSLAIKLALISAGQTASHS